MKVQDVKLLKKGDAIICDNGGPYTGTWDVTEVWHNVYLFGGSPTWVQVVKRDQPTFVVSWSIFDSSWDNFRRFPGTPIELPESPKKCDWAEPRIVEKQTLLSAQAVHEKAIRSWVARNFKTWPYCAQMQKEIPLEYRSDGYNIWGELQCDYCRRR